MAISAAASTSVRASSIARISPAAVCAASRIATADCSAAAATSLALPSMPRADMRRLRRSARAAHRLPPRRSLDRSRRCRRGTRPPAARARRCAPDAPVARYRVSTVISPSRPDSRISVSIMRGSRGSAGSHAAHQHVRARRGRWRRSSTAAPSADTRPRSRRRPHARSIRPRRARSVCRSGCADRSTPSSTRRSRLCWRPVAGRRSLARAIASQYALDDLARPRAR